MDVARMSTFVASDVASSPVAHLFLQDFPVINPAVAGLLSHPAVFERCTPANAGWASGDDRVTAQIEAVADVVIAAFPYLDIDAILRPKQGANDGSIFARQVMIYLLINVFAVPKKRLAALDFAALKKIKQACRTVEAGRQMPRFAVWIEQLGAEATNIFALYEVANG